MSGRTPADFAGEITHRGIINTAECDENDHMNVQFYWARFALADAQFRMMQGLDGVAGADCVRLSRHVRYHAEIHGAFGLHIVSRFVLGPAGDLCVLHQMIHSDRGSLSATALDQLRLSPAVEATIRAGGDIAEVPPSALPRSLTGADADFGQSEAAWIAQGAVLTCRTMIEPHLTGTDGLLTDRGFVSLSVEAAPASWSHGGYPQHQLVGLGLGRVALEKRIVVNRRPRAGDLVHVLTRITAAERVTFSFRHHYFDSRTRAFLATCDITVLPMDLSRRKAVPLPDEIRARMQSLVAGATSDA